PSKRTSAPAPDSDSESYQLADCLRHAHLCARELSTKSEANATAHAVSACFPRPICFVPGAAASRLPAQNAIERIRCVMDQCIRVMRVGMEIFEGKEPAVTDFVERFGHGGPVRGAIEQRPKRLERVIGPFLGEFLEMNVLGAFAEDRHPVFGVLKHRDIAGVEVD